MVIQVDLTTLIAVGTAVGLAGAAAGWAFRRYDELRKVPLLIKRVNGDPEAADPKTRDGMYNRLDDTEATVAEHRAVLRAFCRAFRVHQTANETEMVEAIRVSMSDPRLAESTGQHQAIVIEPPRGKR